MIKKSKTAMFPNHSVEKTPLTQTSLTLTLTVEEAIQVIASLDCYVTLLRKDAEVANHQDIVDALVGEANAMTSLVYRIESSLGEWPIL
jgi:hypothetical protein